LCRSSIVPKYLPTVCDTPATGSSLTLIADTALDTTDDSKCSGGVIAQSLAPDICVLRYGSISVPPGVTFSVAGSRVLALVADDGLSVDGVLDVSADETKSPPTGPGGGFTFSGARSDDHVGGGGAGLRTVGAPGGNATTNGGAANGGAASNPLMNPALVGGPSSGVAGANGGVGGGGATLISCRGSITISGTLDAGGGGGSPGFQLVQTPPKPTLLLGGGGGGAGGYVVLQARTINVTGRVYANGGGGGEGLNGTPTRAPGADGGRSLAPAPGGGTFPNESSGGAGAAGTTVAKPGSKATGSTTSAGGGGGSMGFFQTYTPAGFTPTLTPSEASPGFEPNLTIDTR
jgi:hypothetical protein